LVVLGDPKILTMNSSPQNWLIHEEHNMAGFAKSRPPLKRLSRPAIFGKTANLVEDGPAEQARSKGPGRLNNGL
jgi:hypothetical protein